MVVSVFVQDVTGGARHNYAVSVQKTVSPQKVDEFIPPPWRGLSPYRFWGRSRRPRIKEDDVIIFIVSDDTLTISVVLSEAMDLPDLAKAIGWKNAEKFPFVFPIGIDIMEKVVDEGVIREIRSYRRTRATFWRIPEDFSAQLLEKIKVLPKVKKEIDDSWIPPRFMKLIEGELSWQEFEDRVIEVLKILGFRAEPLGHKAKYIEAPDAIIDLKIGKRVIKVVVDAKNQDGYRISAQDRRAMIDYCKRVTEEECDELYLLIIARSFSRDQEEQIKDMLSEIAKLKSVPLLDANNLIYLLQKKLKNPHSIDIRYLYRELLLEKGIVNKIR